ncbi:hypothetical protein L6R46_20785 [Myxococcota bacterium]|nr:hypothetical protein [Myxococcota bacterium]
MPRQELLVFGLGDLRLAADNVAAARDRRAAIAAQVSEARGRLKATKLAAHNLAKPRLLAPFYNNERRVRSFFKKDRHPHPPNTRATTPD